MQCHNLTAFIAALCPDIETTDNKFAADSAGVNSGASV